ncbi:GumC family protein [Aquimarina pacifica]|uniref:GumC family protein n=1 Tax=Aquimarina pacifica TaxID=1296415 RepID=UPI000471012F|nr:tyrosine-protein kinase family protein [Aquimarina pacifica]
MKDPIYILDNEREDSLSLKENLLRYAYKWPWFLASVFFCIIVGFLYIRYAPVIFSTEAKIKIIDDSKEFDIATDALSLLGAGSKINLDNEVAVIKSYRLLEQVVTTLNLDVEYYEVGNVKNRRVFQCPVMVEKLFENDNIEKPLIYSVSIEGGVVKITNPANKTISMDAASVNFTQTNFPIKIALNKNEGVEQHQDKDFLIKIKNKKETILQLIKELNVKSFGDKSDVLSITIKNESSDLSEAIVNELIAKFNTDGILDRQLVSKRTLDFIDDRFLYLSKELDSIEIDKKEYKQSNNLSYIEADAGITIEKKSIAESEVFRLETQIELSKLLKGTLNDQTSFSLLPADIGVENTSINSLVYEYNQVVLQREKLITSAGPNNPTVQLLSSQLAQAKLNIINTVTTYQNQLRVSLRQLRKKESSAGAMFTRLPEKEKKLRAIERQQFIKENLFLLLLQKREEAAINFAVTAPSVKVVDYGLTSLKPVSPKKIIILGFSIILGLFIPLAFFFTKFFFDTKLKTKSDLEKLSNEIPVLAEIPSLKDPMAIFETNERSVKAESFRILCTNVNYLLPRKNNGDGHVVYITSAIKGEGKTLIALNLAMAFSSLNKKVLLIGADLRNPQLHNYFDSNKNKVGLSSYLYDSQIAWEDCIYRPHDDENSFPDVCFSGPIPLNAAELVAGDNLEKFLEYAKKEYDFIILDTAPTVLVADTLLMANHADATIFITRSNYTDKRLIQFSKDLSKTQKLKNMAYVFNDVKFNKRAGYNYGYEYGYGPQ